jgi:hypothetical protein
MCSSEYGARFRNPCARELCDDFLRNVVDKHVSCEATMSRRHTSHVFTYNISFMPN